MEKFLIGEINKLKILLFAIYVAKTRVTLKVNELKWTSFLHGRSAAEAFYLSY